jgi:hypothetical protein
MLAWPVGARAASPSCEVNAKTTMLSGRFTEAEVEITVGYGAPDCANAAGATNVTLQHARCYWNPFVDLTSNEGCDTTNKASSPDGIWQEQYGAFSWTDPAGQYTKSGSFWLTATVATDEADAVYYVCDWGGFKPDGAKVHCSGRVKRL